MFESLFDTIMTIDIKINCISDSTSIDHIEFTSNLIKTLFQLYQNKILQ